MTAEGYNEREAAGSVWNAGSWQWEERNLNKDSKRIFEEEVPKLEVEAKSGPLVAKLEKLDSIEGSISIRKGKKIVCWTISAEVRLAEKENEENICWRQKIFGEGK